MNAPADHNFEGAVWIWPQSCNWDLLNCYALFRKDFSLARLPKQAPLFITADQSYQLYINGEYVCRGPARGHQKSWPYDEVDVRPFLKPGRNVLAVRAYNPGYGNFQYVSQRFAGLLVAARWGKTVLLSDASWKCRRQPGIRRGTVPTSLQLFFQEHIDLRAEDPSWMLPDCDDRDWTGFVASHPRNGMPWSALESRGLPMLEEIEIGPPACLGVASGRCAEGYLTTLDVTRTRYGEGLAHRRATLDVGTLRVPAGGKRRFRSYLLDFGKTVVGSVGFEIAGARGGDVIDTLHVETINEATLTPDFEPDKHCRMAFGHRLICRAGKQTHVFYHTFGFRYMVLTVRDNPAALNVRPFLRTTLYPLEQRGAFHSSDADLQRIWETCVWTQRVCSLDAYVDTPWREQVQWWGDARVQAKNTFFLSGDTRLFRRGIAQIAMQTTADGLTYGHAPTIAHHCILPDFTLIWMLTLWDDYWQTGSLDTFLAHQGTLQGALGYFRKNTDPNTGLVGYDKRYWLFLDWTDIFKNGYPAVYNFWLLIVLEKLAAMYRIARMPAQARPLTGWAQSLRRSLGRLVRKDGLVADGLTFDRKLVDHASIHSQTLAVLAGFQPEHHAVRFEKSLLPYIRGEATPDIIPSAYWITYVFQVLAEAGFGAEVVDCVRARWLPMAEHGTTWENFAPRRGDESFSHAWSAHPLYHLMEILGGVRQTAPGWKEISFAPEFVGDSANVVVPTPLGAIRSDWTRDASGLRVSLKLPKGITATVRLPGKKGCCVLGGKTWNLDEE